MVTSKDEVTLRFIVPECGIILIIVLIYLHRADIRLTILRLLASLICDRPLEHILQRRCLIPRVTAVLEMNKVHLVAEEVII